MFRSKWFLGLNIALFLIFITLSVSALIAYKTIPSISNIDSCFKTSLYHVNLCPGSNTYVSYKQLPEHLVFALIVSEDASFFAHQGFDWREIQNSLRQNLNAGRWVRGGSTITQQLAKNLYLSKEKSLIRKLKEFFIAHQIEKKLPKYKILEKYFNVVEFGPDIYGIHQASQYYFKKHPSELTPAESAYLVSLLPSPVKYSTQFRTSKELSDFNKERVEVILLRLWKRERITEEEYNYNMAKAEKGLWSSESETFENYLFGLDNKSAADDEEINEERPIPEPVEEVAPADKNKDLPIESQSTESPEEDSL